MKKVAKLNDIVTNMPCSYGESLGVNSIELPVAKVSNIGPVGGFHNSFEFRSFKKDQAKKLVVSEGDLLVVKSSGSKTNVLSGKTALCEKSHEGKLVSSNFLMRLKPNKGKVIPKYLWYYLNSIYSKAFVLKIVGTTTYPNLKWGTYSDHPIPLPTLLEQKRIAAILDKADAIRRKRRQAIKLADEFLRSVFLDMFGDPIKNTKDWKLSRFGDVCESRLGKMLDSKQQTGKNKRKYLRNANVQWDQFDLNNLLEMDFQEKDRDTFRLKHGDLLICEGGEIGRAAIWRNEISECYFQKALHRIRPKSKLATAEYLLHLMWFFARNGGFKNHATSATIAHLTGVKLKEMVIPLPPIEAQKKFSNYYFFAKSLRIKYSHLINDSQSLFNSISQRAFRGEL